MSVITSGLEIIVTMWVVLYTWSFATWLRSQKRPGVWPTRILAIGALVIPITVRLFQAGS